MRVDEDAGRGAAGGCARRNAGNTVPALAGSVILLTIAIVATASAMMVVASPSAHAKRPGSTYCFVGKCHRVKTISEMRRLIGKDVTLYASHYSHCSKDRYNPCGLTSSGARFKPQRPDNAASPIYPDGTRLLIWNPATKAAALVRIDNAGPYWGNRKLDVSRATAESLGFSRQGVAKLKTRVISAPTVTETRYRKYRKYEPVAGYFGKFDSIDAAEQALAAVMAVRAMAASALAPVSAAAVASSHAEPVQAERQRRKLARRAAQRIARVETVKAKTGSILIADARRVRRLRQTSGSSALTAKGPGRSLPATALPATALPATALPATALPAKRPPLRLAATSSKDAVPLPGRKARPQIALAKASRERTGVASKTTAPPPPVRIAALTTPLPQLSPRHQLRRLASPNRARDYQPQTDGEPIAVASPFAIKAPSDRDAPPLPELGPARWRIKAASLPPPPTAKPLRVADNSRPDTLDDLAWHLEQVLIDRHFRLTRKSAINLMDQTPFDGDAAAPGRQQPRLRPVINRARAGRMG